MIELYARGSWHEAAKVELRSGTSRRQPTWLSYDLDYASHTLGRTGLSAVSERYPVSFELHDEVTFPAFTVDLMPQGEARRGLEARLRRDGREPSDWTVLMFGARNPVGNLRVKQSVVAGVGDPIGVTRTEVVERGDAYREWAEARGLPMTGSSDTGGASPKLLLTADADGLLHADGVLPDELAAKHYIVKFPRGRTRRDAQVLANEAPYLELARMLGLRVGEALSYESGALFIPRFDRVVTERGLLRRGMESMFSLLGEVASGSTLEYENVCAAVAEVSSDPSAELVELVLRDVANLALGNTDNHGRNTSLLKQEDGRVELAPIYDFAPMFLDPELIKRSTRWRSERSPSGMPDWNDVCDALAGLIPREVLAPRLREFSERLHALPGKMLEVGVDREIRQRLERGIHELARALTTVEGD